MENYSPLILTFRYQNAPAAIDWLCKAFGFRKRVVFEETPGIIANAQLTFGNAMIMVSTARKSAFDEIIRLPRELNDYNAQTPYLIVEAIDEHYRRALAEGAEMLIDIQDEDFGSRGYTCRDPEGYIWNFGTYNPWKN